MKKSSSLLPVLAVACVLPFALVAQATERASNPSSQGSGSADAHASSSIRLLRGDEGSQRTTSSSLIGTELHDVSGAVIGEIRDIDLSGAFGAPAGGTGVGLIIALTEDDQLISIPASAVRSSTAGDVQLSLSRDDLRQQIGTSSSGALASAADSATSAEEIVVSTDGAPAIDPANTIAPVAVAAPSGTDNNLQVSTAGLEVEKIQTALAEAEETRDVADSIAVLSATDSVLLTGQLQNEEQRENVLTVVRAATERDVRDLMTVTGAAE